MSCWCDRGSWHHWSGQGPGWAGPGGCGCGPGAHNRWGPVAGYGRGYGDYGPGLERPRRRRTRTEELEEYLRDLEEEVAEVRTELQHLRGPSAEG